MRDEKDYTILNKLIKITIDLNNRLYKRVIKKKFDSESQERVDIYLKRTPHSYYKKINLGKKCYADGYTGSISIKLDFIIHSKKKNPRIK